MNDCDPMGFCALLSVGGAHFGNGQWTEDKIASPHSFTSFATDAGAPLRVRSYHPLLMAGLRPPARPHQQWTNSERWEDIVRTSRPDRNVQRDNPNRERRV